MPRRKQAQRRTPLEQYSSILPLTDSKLKGRRLKHPRARLLVKFPDNSVPFIPDGYWHGGKKFRGCYHQKHTRMVLIMYESENNGVLQPIDNDTLQQKLAAWMVYQQDPNSEPCSRETTVHWDSTCILRQHHPRAFPGIMEVLET